MKSTLIVRLAAAAVSAAAVLAVLASPAAARAEGKKIVLLAGGPSHGFGAHDHLAGCTLLAKCLEEGIPGLKAVVVKGWPSDPAVFDGAASVVIFCDGGGGHLALRHMDQLQALVNKGVGFVCLHYAVEVPKGEPGDKFLQWLGGYFETFWSVNPHWKAEFKSFPDHPVARGVKPFAIDDEWYYHMRFPEGMKGVTPILTAVPPDSTRQRGDDAHGGNPVVRAGKGQAEHVAWAFVRDGGGRSFGFTGGHHHWNWANDNFRTVVLNGIVWTAGLEVPAGGVPSKTPTVDELLTNHDEPMPPNFDRQRVQKMIDEWKAAK